MKTYEEGFAKGFSHNIKVVEELETELDLVSSKASELSKRIFEALIYIDDKAPGVSTLILDTENKVKLKAILLGMDENRLLKAVLKGSDK